jgi:hydrogenase maturation protein HypF
VTASGTRARDPPRPGTASPIRRLRHQLAVRGAVQGVGFRPFVYRLAHDLGLDGWVRNAPHGVMIEAEGTPEQLAAFRDRLRRERPPLSLVERVEVINVALRRARGFEILASVEGEPTALVLPDIATCGACLREIFDPADRRYLYPFTNCTHCGPRYSIIRALPYDRANTTMETFAMCGRCRAEFDDPRNRRFHAQPNACSDCGPRLALWDVSGAVLERDHAALRAAAEAVRQGSIVGLKGLGGFQLLVDARRDDAVRRLRARKAREAKPFALMVATLDMARHYCHLSSIGKRLLTSPQAPIVLLRRSPCGASEIAPAVAPDNPYLGLMLPYTALHHILMADLAIPVVATSGNVCDEPICTDEHEALQRLHGIADLFLVHDRPIARHVDDSVVCVAAGRDQVLRRARGYAPFPIRLAAPVPPLLATGGQLKTAVAVAVGNNVLLSQHIGDLGTAPGLAAFDQTVTSLRGLYNLSPVAVACDRHPDYLSTRYAQGSGCPVISIQHHVAHVLACMAEHRLGPPVLGVAWDGTGFGLDGTIWGGEFFHVTDGVVHRVAHLRTFRLPGGEKAIAEPRRAALGLLYELLGPDLGHRTGLAPVAACSPAELKLFLQMLEHGTNAPLTSSVGRLFDAVASLLDLRHVAAFEGQAAMALEFAADRAAMPGGASLPPYPLPLIPASPDAGRFTVDWAPMVLLMLEDLRHGVAPSAIAASFHEALTELMVSVTQRVGETRVVLSGGCFQNRLLTGRAVTRLRQAGLTPYWHRKVPPNDGGISLGQVVAAAQLLRERTRHVSRRTREDRQHRAD